jgi:uncharacterized protein
MSTFWIVLYVIIGLVIGVLSGMLGIGGGVLLVPVLVWCGFKYKQAVGTSLAVLVPPIGLPAAWRHFHDGDVDLGAAICIACAFVVGGYFGASLVKELDARFLRLFFGVFLMFVAMRFIVSGSDETTMAVAGLTASLVSLIAFAFLYLLGRRALTPAAQKAQQTGLDLGQNIRTSRDEGYTDPDYYI